jgi:hypothetical protein
VICLPFTPPFLEWEYRFEQLNTHATLSFDDMITVLAFLRLYNLAKFIREYYYLLDAKALSLCRMFHFSAKWNFVVKGLMHEHQYKFMLAITAVLCIGGAYILRVLERTAPNERLGNMWH